LGYVCLSALGLAVVRIVLWSCGHAGLQERTNASSLFPCAFARLLSDNRDPRPELSKSAVRTSSYRSGTPSTPCSSFTHPFAGKHLTMLIVLSLLSLIRDTAGQGNCCAVPRVRLVFALVSQSLTVRLGHVQSPSGASLEATTAEQPALCLSMTSHAEVHQLAPLRM
jgi:hypothetical protein